MLMYQELLGSNAQFDQDLFRNIATAVPAQAVFDDLAEDIDTMDYALLADVRGRVDSLDPLVTRPFDYGVDLSYPFDDDHLPLHATRFSDGSSFGVWYGSLSDRTTVHESVYHWVTLVRNMNMDYDKPIIADRRIYTVRCTAMLVDMRGMEVAFPDLVHPHDYTFTHKVGRYLEEQGSNGFLVKSARCDGINVGIFRAKVLSGPRDYSTMKYTWVPAERDVVVEKQGKLWCTIQV
jgi:hypothetical protein